MVLRDVVYNRNYSIRHAIFELPILRTHETRSSGRLKEDTKIDFVARVYGFPKLPRLYDTLICDIAHNAMVFTRFAFHNVIVFGASNFFSNDIVHRNPVHVINNKGIKYHIRLKKNCTDVAYFYTG